MFIKLCVIIISLFTFNTKYIFPLKSDSRIETNQNFKNYIPRYLLGPGDALSIKVYKLPSLNSNITVMPDGYINLPRIKSINLEGLNLQEAKNKITNEGR